MSKSNLRIIAVVVGVILTLLIIIAVVDHARQSPPEQLLCSLEPVSTPEDECEVWSSPKFPMSLLAIVGQPGYNRSDYEILDAVRLEPNQLAIVQTLSGGYLYTTEVGYTTFPQNRTVIYPTSPVIIITERDSDKCQTREPFRYCDTPMDNIILQGGVSSQADFSLTFSVAINTDETLNTNLADLYAFGGMDSLIDQIKQNVRSLRSEMSDVSPMVLVEPIVTETGDAEGTLTFGKDILAARIYDKLSQGVLRAYVQIDPDDINVRSFVITDTEYLIILDERAAIEARAATDQTSRDAELLQNEFQREQQLADAQTYGAVIQTICASVPEGESCAAMLWILLSGEASPQPINIDGFTGTTTGSVQVPLGGSSTTGE